MLVTAPGAAWLTLHYGWRAAFLVSGAVGFLLIPPWLLLQHRIKQVYGQPDPAPASVGQEANRSGAGDLPLREVLRRRKYWLLLSARAITDAVWYFYLFWLPGYFQDVRAYDLERVGKLLWIPYFCADVGALGGAWLSSVLIQRGMGLDRGRKTVLIGSAILCVVGAGAFFVPVSSLALGLVSLALFGHLSWSSNLHTVITEVTPPKHVAVLYGITGAAGTLMGAITQPLVGRAVDGVGYGPAFVGAGMTYLLALGLLLGAGKIETIQ
jgi:ACS family hexuronate transporter-like MFS transporter